MEEQIMRDLCEEMGIKWVYQPGHIQPVEAQLFSPAQ